MKDSPDYEIQRVLQDMRDEYWRSLEEVEANDTGATRDYLVVRLGGERFGIETALTREVLRAPRLVRVPQVPPQVRGIINLRGQIVAVIDLRGPLGLPLGDDAGSGQLVVTEAAGLTSALWTEQVEGIRSISVAAIEPLTAGLAQLPRGAVAGQVLLEDGLLVLLDLPQLLSREDFIIDQKGE